MLEIIGLSYLGHFLSTFLWSFACNNEKVHLNKKRMRKKYAMLSWWRTQYFFLDSVFVFRYRESLSFGHFIFVLFCHQFVMMFHSTVHLFSHRIFSNFKAKSRRWKKIIPMSRRAQCVKMKMYLHWADLYNGKWKNDFVCCRTIHLLLQKKMLNSF